MPQHPSLFDIQLHWRNSISERSGQFLKDPKSFLQDLIKAAVKNYVVSESGDFEIPFQKQKTKVTFNRAKILSFGKDKQTPAEAWETLSFVCFLLGIKPWLVNQNVFKDRPTLSECFETIENFYVLGQVFFCVSSSGNETLWGHVDQYYILNPEEPLAGMDFSLKLAKQSSDVFEVLRDALKTFYYTTNERISWQQNLMADSSYLKLKEMANQVKQNETKVNDDIINLVSDEERKSTNVDEVPKIPDSLNLTPDCHQYINLVSDEEPDPINVDGEPKTPDLLNLTQDNHVEFIRNNKRPADKILDLFPLHEEKRIKIEKPNFNIKPNVFLHTQHFKEWQKLLNKLLNACFEEEPLIPTLLEWLMERKHITIELIPENNKDQLVYQLIELGLSVSIQATKKATMVDKRRKIAQALKSQFKESKLNQATVIEKITNHLLTRNQENKEKFVNSFERALKNDMWWFAKSQHSTKLKEILDAFKAIKTSKYQIQAQIAIPAPDLLQKNHHIEILNLIDANLGLLSRKNCIETKGFLEGIIRQFLFDTRQKFLNADKTKLQIIGIHQTVIEMDYVDSDILNPTVPLNINDIYFFCLLVGIRPWIINKDTNQILLNPFELIDQKYFIGPALFVYHSGFGTVDVPTALTCLEKQIEISLDRNISQCPLETLAQILAQNYLPSEDFNWNQCQEQEQQLCKFHQKSSVQDLTDTSDQKETKDNLNDSHKQLLRQIEAVYASVLVLEKPGMEIIRVLINENYLKTENKKGNRIVHATHIKALGLDIYQTWKNLHTGESLGTSQEQQIQSIYFGTSDIIQKYSLAYCLVQAVKNILKTKSKTSITSKIISLVQMTGKILNLQLQRPNSPNCWEKKILDKAIQSLKNIENSIGTKLLLPSRNATNYRADILATIDTAAKASNLSRIAYLSNYECMRHILNLIIDKYKSQNQMADGSIKLNFSRPIILSPNKEHNANSVSFDKTNLLVLTAALGIKPYIIDLNKNHAEEIFVEEFGEISNQNFIAPMILVSENNQWGMIDFDVFITSCLKSANADLIKVWKFPRIQLNFATDGFIRLLKMRLLSEQGSHWKEFPGALENIQIFKPLIIKSINKNISDKPAPKAMTYVVPKPVENLDLKKDGITIAHSSKFFKPNSLVVTSNDPIKDRLMKELSFPK